MRVARVLMGSFLDELEKIAVNTKVLSSNLSKVKGMFEVDSGLVSSYGGAVTFPSMRVQAASIKDTLNYGRRSAMKLLDKVPIKRVRDGLKHKANKAVDAQMDSAIGEMSLSHMLYPQRAGAILYNPDAIKKTFRSGANVHSSVVDTLGDSALVDATRVHELYERGVKAKNVRRVYSHLSPEVLLKEHNLVSRLTGPGSDFARSTISKTRDITGESKYVRNLIVNKYGPRAAQFLEDGSKIPRAMRKDIVRSIQRDPDFARTGFRDNARAVVGGNRISYRVARDEAILAKKSKG